MPPDDLDEDALEERRWLQREARADQTRERAAIDDRTDHLPFTLRAASRAVDAAVRHSLAGAELGELPLSALQVLVLARQVRSIARLAALLHVSQQAASQLVGQLERRALVVKEVSPWDARARVVSTTEAGEELLVRVREHLLYVLGHVADQVGDGVLEEFEAQLARVALLEPAGPDLWGRW